METTQTTTPPEARRVARLIIGGGRPPRPRQPPRVPVWKPGPSVPMTGKNKNTDQLALGAKRRKPPEDLRRTIDENATAVKTSVDSLNAIGTDTVQALERTKNYGRSDGLKKLVKLVKEIDTEYKAIEQTRNQRSREKQPPLDFNTAYGPLLKKLGETSKACSEYIQDHENREGRDDQSNAARTLSTQLTAITNGLLGPQNLMQEVNRKLRSSENIPSLDDLEMLGSLARDPNAPREVKEEAIRLLVGDPTKVRAQIVGTGDAELLSAYAHVCKEDEVDQIATDLLTKYDNDGAQLVSLMTQMSEDELSRWTEGGDMPLRGNTLTTKLLARFGRKSGGVALSQVTQVTKNALKDLPSGLKLNPSDFKPEERVSIEEVQQRLLQNKWASEQDIQEVLNNMRQQNFNLDGDTLANELVIKKKISPVQQAELLTNDTMRENQKAVKELLNTVLATITDDTFLSSFGPEVQTLCANIYEATAKRKPVNTGNQQTDEENSKFCEKIVGGYVLLRLINPTLTDEANGPLKEAAARETEAAKQLNEAKKLADNDPNKAETVRLAQENLDKAKKVREEAAEMVKYTTLLTKMLQYVSNGTIPNDYMATLSDAIQGCDQPMRLALNKLVKEGKSVQQGGTGQTPTQNPTPQTGGTTPPETKQETKQESKQEEAPMTPEVWKQLLAGEDWRQMATKLIEVGIDRGDAVQYVKDYRALKANPSVELMTECASVLKKIQAINHDLAGLILRVQLQPIREFLLSQKK